MIHSGEKYGKGTRAVPLDGPSAQSDATESTAVIMVVDDHASARRSVAEILTAAGYEVIATSSGAEALQRLADQAVDLIFTDLMMPGMDGLEFIRILNDRRIESQVVMFTAHASIGTAVQAMRLGAFDYLEKPFNVDQLEDVARRALQHGLALGRRSCVPEAGEWAPQMIGQSVAMQQLRQLIQQAAPTDETVLITGESGTGKELVARAIHAVSQRRDRTWVGLNCPALSPQLMESELFGHERGAFTNADAPRVGRFELADGGTILLDEVSEIELDLQAKLLRVLQERQFERVGSSVSRPLDVRIIASTNRDLHQEIKAGRFREDLFYRLAVIPIQVPPLRRRVEDIPLLARHFLHKACQRTGRAPGCLTDSALDLLVQHAWPGNVRELENVMTRVAVLGPATEIHHTDLQPWLLPTDSPNSPPPVGYSPALPTIPIGFSLQQMERQLIEATLEQFQGHRQKSAAALGIGVRTLTNKLREYGYAPREKTYVQREGRVG
jgi:DNA-binding NtrC family response regulator